MDPRLIELITRDYARIGPLLLEPFIETIRVGRTIGDGDLDKLLIMTVVGLRTIAHPAFKGRRVRDVILESAPVPTLGVNSRSLAEALPIARETVRRKVTELIAEGYLQREGNTLHYTPLALDTMQPFRRQVVRLAEAYHDLMTGLEGELD